MGLEGLGISESTEKRRLSTHRFACNPVCNPNAKIYAIMGKNLLYKARNKDYEKKNFYNDGACYDDILRQCVCVY